MKSISSFFLLLGVHAPLISGAQEYRWQDMPDLEYGIELEDYNDTTIYAFNRFLLTEEEGFVPNFESEALPLDIHHYWNRREEDYEVLLTKTAYTIDQSADYFSASRLASTEYISASMPEARLKKEDSVYHLSIGFGTPDIDYSLKFYSQDELDSKYPGLWAYFVKYNDISIGPEIISVQHNFKYGKVLFQRTSKMSTSFTLYFDKGQHKTLIVNYTLNYIVNMPPDFVGGKDYLLERMNEGILALIRETRRVAAEHKPKQTATNE